MKPQPKYAELLAQLGDDCADILGQLMVKYPFLSPEHPSFGILDGEDAIEVVADILILMQKSNAIDKAYNELDWGK